MSLAVRVVIFFAIPVSMFLLYRFSVRARTKSARIVIVAAMLLFAAVAIPFMLRTASELLLWLADFAQS